jgi:hypothetical protein
MESQRVAALSRSHPRRSLSGEGDLLAAESRLIAHYGAGAPLALKALAHRNPRWFTINRKVKLPAAACGTPDGH